MSLTGKVAPTPKWISNFYSLPNLAIPASYFCVGVALQLLRTPLIVYLINECDAGAADVNILFTVMAIPWCFKVFYGFLSDCCPIHGLRRTPYLIFGWLIYFMSNILLFLIGTPSIGVTIFLVFVMTSGYMLADVMTDALIVERSFYEPTEHKGSLQSLGYVIRLVFMPLFSLPFSHDGRRLVHSL